MSQDLSKLIEDLTHSKLTRRQFITRAAALGVGMSAIGSILAACGGGAATPAATETAAGGTTPTAAATETAAATATTAAAGGATPANTVVIASSGDLAGWDPATSIYWLANETIINTHDVLIDYDTMEDAGLTKADVGKLRSELADSYTFSPDGTTLTIKLKDGQKFQNGDPVDAQAIKDCFVRYLNTAGTAQFLIRDCGNIKAPEQITVVDPLTVEFKAPTPTPLLEKIMPEMNMVVSNAKEIQSMATASDPDAAEWTKTHTTGTGPYTIGTYEPGTQLVLNANTNYWGGAPKVEKIVYKVVPTPEDRLLLLQNGDVDIVYEVPLKDVATLQSNANIETVSVHTPGNTNVIMDNTVAPFDNVKVRQAISYAVNYDRIIKEANYGLAAPLTAAIPKGVQYHLEGSLPYKYDTAKAKSLLSEAGYPDGKGFPQLKFALKMGVPEEEATAIYIQDDLKQVGIDMVIDKMTMAAHSEQLQKKELAFTFNYFIPYVPDPVYHLFWNYTPDSPINYSKYSNQQVTDAINTLLTEVDPAKVQAGCEQVQKLVAEDAPMLYLYQPTWNLAISKKLTGYRYYPDHLTRFKYFTKG